MTLFAPVLTPMLRERTLALAISTAALIQFALTLFHLPTWPCPFLHSLGVPCPGCGMTRATLMLVEGQWQQSISMHAFAPGFVVALLVITLCAIAPETYVTRIANSAEVLERRTGIIGFIFIALILYWLGRLLVMPVAFARLIQG